MGVRATRWAEKVVVVTGASAGVGRATAVEFGRRGAAVALLARGAEGLRGVAEEVQAVGGRALTVPVDVADPDAVELAAERVEAELGPIAVWVNDAFTSVFARVVDVRPEEFRRVLEVCFLGYVYGTLAALRRMSGRGGAIVQVGSALAYRGIPLQAPYCAAKHAIQGFHESLRCELLHDKSPVRVTMVQLPAVNTPQFDWLLARLPKRPQPVPPIYQPEVAARAIVWAAGHPARREYWVGGSTALTLLANAVAPGLLDRYLARTGFASQQTPDPAPANAEGNLWRPADSVGGRDFGTHGRFDRVAKVWSPQALASRHHRALGTAAALAGAAGVAAGAAGVVRGRAARRRAPGPGRGTRA